jgi:putative hydrolase
MPFIGDYHTHSNYSDGRQSVKDIIEAADKKGFMEVAITDHGPLAAVIGVKNSESYLEIKEEVQQICELKSYQVKALIGAEANIRGMDGRLDLPDAVIEELDILIAGLHPYTWPSSPQDACNVWIQNSLRHLGKSQQEKAINANTKASVETIYQNQRLDILSHPGLFFKVHIEEVARACVKKEVLFEINCGHEQPSLSDIMIADKVGVNFIVNSDAHFSHTVGNLEYGLRAIQKLGINPDRISNWME